MLSKDQTNKLIKHFTYPNLFTKQIRMYIICAIHHKDLSHSK